MWRHGDFSVTNPLTGGVTILGYSVYFFTSTKVQILTPELRGRRSDATLNPGGVRIGTAELYRALDQLAARKALPI